MQLHSLLRRLSFSTSTRYFTTTSSPSFTVQYLTSSCGLSLSSALSISKTLTLTESSAPAYDSILSLLRAHSFSPSEISSLLSSRPSLLRTRRPDLTLAPKLHFLLTIHGLPPSLVSSNPMVLARSLRDHLVPTMDLLHSFLAGSSSDLLLALRRFRWLLTCSLSTSLAPNLALLLSLRVPRPHIAKLLATHPRTFLVPSAHFSRAVSTVSRLGGIPADALLFVHAVRAVVGMREETFRSRMELLKGFGWEEEDIWNAFRRAPMFILVSEGKMRKNVAYLQDVVGLSSKDMSRQPKLLMYGLESRVAPRFAVFRALEEKELVGRGKRGIGGLFTCSEEEFLERYVRRFRLSLPELGDLVDGKVRMEDLPSLLPLKSGST